MVLLIYMIHDMHRLAVNYLCAATLAFNLWLVLFENIVFCIVIYVQITAQWPLNYFHYRCKHSSFAISFQFKCHGTQRSNQSWCIVWLRTRTKLRLSVKYILKDEVFSDSYTSLLPRYVETLMVVFSRVNFVWFFPLWNEDLLACSH